MISFINLSLITKIKITKKEVQHAHEMVQLCEREKCETLARVYRSHHEQFSKQLNKLLNLNN